jgi:hypothetical protein
MTVMRFKTFGEWLRHYRLQKEISPFRMAEALGYKRVSAIYNFEYGIAPLPITKWPAMAVVLQLSIEEFLKIMGSFSPDKVTEFELIRGTAVPSDAGLSRKTADGDEEPSTVIVPTSVRGTDETMRAYRVTDADLVFMTREDWEDSLLVAADQLRRHRRTRLGLLQMIEGDPFPAASVVSVLKEVKTVCVLELHHQDEPPVSLAAQLKAAFLDALTGAEGYPEIHRVPKIFSAMVQPPMEEWTAHGLGNILQYFEENSRRRHLTVKMERPVSDLIKRR